jgi:hypothetical protein
VLCASEGRLKWRKINGVQFQLQPFPFTLASSSLPQKFSLRFLSLKCLILTFYSPRALDESIMWKKRFFTARENNFACELKVSLQLLLISSSVKVIFTKIPPWNDLRKILRVHRALQKNILGIHLAYQIEKIKNRLMT